MAVIRVASGPFGAPLRIAAPSGSIALRAPAPPAQVPRTTAIAAALVVLLAVAGVGWAPGLVHRATPIPTTRAPSAPFDVDAAIERASHAVRPSGRAGTLGVHDAG